MAGPSRHVPADPGRRPVTRGEFVAAHFRPGARPLGHGFTDENLRNGTAYYVHDTPAARFIALDTNCLAGGADGCLDRQQARWLEDRLAEVHSAYRGPAGQEIATGQDDRLVILFSHHGVDTLTNTRGWHPGPGGEPLIGAGELIALLHRFPNVVLWLNGHTHTNAIRPRPDPDQPGRGFWEVTTCAVVDWPCQTRLVELAERGGQLSITCTMVDHDTPLGPPRPGRPGGAAAALFSPDDLAALHRELAANIPFGGGYPGRTGAATDRNVELLISPPFPLAPSAGGVTRPSFAPPMIGPVRRESSTVVVLVGAVAEPLLAGLARSSNVSLVRPPDEEKDRLTAAALALGQAAGRRVPVRPGARRPARRGGRGVGRDVGSDRRAGSRRRVRGARRRGRGRVAGGPVRAARLLRGPDPGGRPGRRAGPGGRPRPDHGTSAGDGTGMYLGPLRAARPRRVGAVVTAAGRRGRREHRAGTPGAPDPAARPLVAAAGRAARPRAALLRGQPGRERPDQRITTFRIQTASHG